MYILNSSGNLCFVGPKNSVKFVDTTNKKFKKFSKINEMYMLLDVEGNIYTMHKHSVPCKLVITDYLIVDFEQYEENCLSYIDINDTYGIYNCGKIVLRATITSKFSLVVGAQGECLENYVMITIDDKLYCVDRTDDNFNFIELCEMLKVKAFDEFFVMNDHSHSNMCLLKTYGVVPSGMIVSLCSPRVEKHIATVNYEYIIDRKIAIISAINLVKRIFIYEEHVVYIDDCGKKYIIDCEKKEIIEMEELRDYYVELSTKMYNKKPNSY
jgi:hypothetical protein